MALFDAARRSFQQSNYADAHGNTNDALAKLPGGARPCTKVPRRLSICSWARYDESATASRYAVLSVGPGWDWTTLIGLYPGDDV